MCSLESLQRLVRTYWSVVLSTWGWKERLNGCGISSLGCVLPLRRLLWQWTDVDKTSRFYFCAQEHRSLLRLSGLTLSKRKSRLEIRKKKRLVIDPLFLEANKNFRFHLVTWFTLELMQMLCNWVVSGICRVLKGRRKMTTLSIMPSRT